jgi:putative addiction module component (TIGR02574 family)
MGMTSQLQELRSLPISERVQLVEDLWDSIAQDASEITLAQDQKDLLDKRLDALDKDPKAGSPWETAKQRIISSL